MFGGETRRPRHPPPSSSRGDGSSSFAARLARRSRVSAARIDPARRDHAAHVESRRSEEHTSELQSLMRITYAVFCFEKTTKRDLDSTILDKHNNTTQNIYTPTHLNTRT